MQAYPTNVTHTVMLSTTNPIRSTEQKANLLQAAQRKSHMDYPATRKAKFSQRALIWFSLAFLASIVFLLVGNLSFLSSWQGLRPRFTGVETTARVSEVGSCGDTIIDGTDTGAGDTFAFTFTDSRGQVHHITNNATCFRGIFTDGESVKLWYEPDNPNNFITENEVSFTLSLVLPALIGFSSPFFIVLVVFIVFLFVRLR